MSSPDALPILILAQAAIPSASPVDPWTNVMINGGIAIGMLGWFMWRDRNESERRDKQHTENSQLQKEQTSALNLMTRAMMVEVLATRHMDDAIRELAQKIKDQAESDNKGNHPS